MTHRTQSSSGRRGQLAETEYQDYFVILSHGAKGESGEYRVKLNEMGLAGLLIGLVAIERGNLDDLSNLEHVTVRNEGRKTINIKKHIPDDILINQGEEAFGSDEESMREHQRHKYAVRVEFSREIVLQYPDRAFENGLEEAFRIESRDPDDYLRYY